MNYKDVTKPVFAHPVDDEQSVTPNPMKGLKIMLVADKSRFSTADVYTGYCSALKRMGAEFEFFPTHQYLDLYSADTVWCMAIAKAVIPENHITNVFFISGVDVPVYVYETLHTHGIRVGVIATDDPHSMRPLFYERRRFIHYYLSNEKASLELHDQRIRYIPVAASNVIPYYEKKSDLPVEYQSDVVFVGSLYPNRIPFLEAAAEWCHAHGKKMIVAGLFMYVQADSILHQCKVGGTIDNQETLKYLQGSECTINISRDVYWHPYLPVNSRLMGVKPYSANPRMYESSMCRTMQIVFDDRPEYREWLGDNAFFFDTVDGLIGAIDSCINTIDPKLYNSMVRANFDKVLSCGCYDHRVVSILGAMASIDSATSDDINDNAFHEAMKEM